MHPKTNSCPRLLLLAMMFVSVSVALPAVARAAGPPGKGRPDIYDKTADGGKQIAEALETATRENKRVLIQFGANWCGWCHKLHDVFKSNRPVARALLYEYVVVLIDVDMVDGEKHNQKIVERYGNPLHNGIPALVVLDSKGRMLIAQETEVFEDGDHHDPEKVLAFLDKWKAEPVSAEAMLSAGLARSKAESKKLFVYFSAPWCGWCHKLTDYLAREDVLSVFNQAFVPVMIDVDRMTGGKALADKYRAERAGGIPFFVVLDADRNKLADSFAEKGNVGFPVLPHEVAHFMKIVSQTTKLSADQLAVLEKGLAAEAPKAR